MWPKPYSNGISLPVIHLVHVDKWWSVIKNSHVREAKTDHSKSELLLDCAFDESRCLRHVSDWIKELSVFELLEIFWNCKSWRFLCIIEYKVMRHTRSFYYKHCFKLDSGISLFSMMLFLRRTQSRVPARPGIWWLKFVHPGATLLLWLAKRVEDGLISKRHKKVFSFFYSSFKITQKQKFRHPAWSVLSNTPTLAPIAARKP